MTSEETVLKIKGQFLIFKYEATRGKETPLPEPHRHDHQEIILVEKGSATHHIDGEQDEVKGPLIILVAQGKIHKFLPHSGARLIVVRFTEEFLPTKGEDLFCQFMQLSKIPLRSPILRKKIHGLLHMLLDDHRAVNPNPEVQRHLLGAYIAILKEERQKLLLHHSMKRSSDYDLFNEFIAQLEQHFRTHQEVTFYAQKLSITTKKLGGICKSIFGESPSRIIEKRVMLEAKRLLMYSNQTVQEIAFRLGYEDHSYFTKSFRKNEGMTPSEFREKKAA